ncbi:MAG: type II toxin-antitoxin system HicA family toxin [Candidatus Eremiobacteraeota bacterium]|nr:type II toxin-antitoxin system HicA family toxin [Candidatus Eremiobacteraeota bacterium]
MKYRQIEALLRKNGWVWVRTNGSHRMFEHPAHPRAVAVPFHGASKDLGTRLAVRILKQAGLR